jgi:hypothetical protein
VSELSRPSRCSICGCTEFWLRDEGVGPPGWLCATCHPRPERLTDAEMSKMREARAAEGRSLPVVRTKAAAKEKGTAGRGKGKR